MKKITDLILLRHGETIANKEGILQGWYESPLNENGKKQAACAAEYLKDASFDAVYSSTSGRAVETIQEVLKYHPALTLRTTPELREWNLGNLEGRSQYALLQEYPDIMRAFREENQNPAAPGGEDRKSFQVRISKVMYEIAKEHPGDRVLICTHGGALQRIFRLVTGIIDPNNIIPLPDNASISHIRYYSETNGWQLESWNIREHLKTLSLHQTLVY